jgi:hypothetical protein
MEVATASTEPWVDANAYLLGYLRGMFPGRPAVLSYRPNEAGGVSEARAVPFHSLELVLLEARAAGGNAVLSIEKEYRRGLLSDDAKAQEAWASLSQTIVFLDEHGDALLLPSRSRTLVAAGSLEQSGEVLNLMYRRTTFPVVRPATEIKTIEGDRFRAVVAVNIPKPPDAVVKTMLDYVRGGGLLVTAPSADSAEEWWLTGEARKGRTEEDRVYYSLGEGRIVAYQDVILDVSEFALDVIDLVGVLTRDLRLWNAETAAGLANGELGASRAYVSLVNYGDPIDQEFPARIEGHFPKATLHEPGQAPRPLSAAKRGPGTEVGVDRLQRFALIELERVEGAGEQWPEYTALPGQQEAGRTF